MFDFQPRLNGALLDLRPAELSDWDGLFAVGGDAQVWAGHPCRERYLPPKFRDYFEEGLASGGALVAIIRRDGQIAGWSRYSMTYAEPNEVEIGWTFLGRAFWGGAYNGEMKRLMLAHAFRFVDRVIFRIDETNARSRRAAEKIGARLTDRAMDTTVDGRPARDVFYAVERGEFTF
jgi:RimJ/RimL family protein N-acetyltransferase